MTERSVVVGATPTTVWAVLADFGAIVEWAPNVDHSCLLSEQEEDVGTVRRVQAGRFTLVETVRSWRPEQELSYDIAGMPAVLRTVVSTWRLGPIGDGSTRVTLSTAVDAGSLPPQRLIARLARRKLAGAADEMLAGLAAHLEETT